MDTGQRRLAAIVFADVVGYSRMMADDEDGTLASLRAHMNAIEPIVLNNGGRVVKSTGDGVLIEFPSAVAGLEAALEAQAMMGTRNSQLPDSRRMLLRIGINVGDILVGDDGDVFGDGVNVAARVEALADPGGVAITDTALQTVRGKVDVAFTDGTEYELKNIPTPVKVWRAGVPSKAPKTVSPPGNRTLATLAVLPFENMSGDPDQDYFADGITEDLLTALSYNKDLAVIARNSTFAYKGKAEDVRTIARTLDASHVVEGSVRRSGSRVRVTAQLIDAESGHHIWAERFDRQLSDIFELQDELVDSIATKLTPSLWVRAGDATRARDASSFDAWDLTIQGQSLVNTFEPSQVREGIELFEKAGTLEPEFVAPIGRSALAWMFLAQAGWRGENVNPWEQGREAADRAYALDKDDYWALSAASLNAGIGGDFDNGARCAHRMIELNPYGFFGYHMLGNNLDKAGEHVGAIESLSRAWQLGGSEPLRFDIANDLAHAHYMESNYDSAATWGLQSAQLVESFLQVDMIMAATHAQLGHQSEAQGHASRVLEIRPSFSCSKHWSRLLYLKDEDRDHFIDGLRKSGLPE